MDVRTCFSFSCRPRALSGVKDRNVKLFSLEGRQTFRHWTSNFLAQQNLLKEHLRLNPSALMKLISVPPFVFMSQWLVCADTGLWWMFLRILQVFLTVQEGLDAGGWAFGRLFALANLPTEVRKKARKMKGKWRGRGSPCGFPSWPPFSCYAGA